MARLRGYEFPASIYHHPEYMVWVAYGDDDRVTLGLSALALATAGELIVFAARPLGALIDCSRAVANVETAKTVSSVRTPVAGRIVEINSALEADGTAINADPYAAWMVRLDPVDWPRDRKALLIGADALAAIERQLALYRVGE